MRSPGADEEVARCGLHGPGRWPSRRAASRRQGGQAATVLSEGDETDSITVSSVRLERRRDHAEVRRAHHPALLQRDIQQRAATQQDLVAARSHEGVEAHLGEQRDRAPSCRAGTAPIRVLGQQPTPRRAGSARVRLRMAARPGDMLCEHQGEGGVVAHAGIRLTGLATGRVLPGGPSTAPTGPRRSRGQATLNERVQVLADGVGVLAEVPGKVACRDRVGGLLKGFQDTGTGRRHRHAVGVVAGGSGSGYFHGAKRSKLTGVGPVSRSLNRLRPLSKGTP